MSHSLALKEKKTYGITNMVSALPHKTPPTYTNMASGLQIHTLKEHSG